MSYKVTPIMHEYLDTLNNLVNVSVLSEPEQNLRNFIKEFNDYILTKYDIKLLNIELATNPFKRADYIKFRAVYYRHLDEISSEFLTVFGDNEIIGYLESINNLVDMVLRHKTNMLQQVYYIQTINDLLITSELNGSIKLDSENLKLYAKPSTINCVITDLHNISNKLCISGKNVLNMCEFFDNGLHQKSSSIYYVMNYLKHKLLKGNHEYLFELLIQNSSDEFIEIYELTEWQLKHNASNILKLK